MHRNELASLLRPMIKEGKTKEVLEALSQFVRGVDRYAENDLLLQTSAFNRNVNDFRNGLITKGDYDIAMARLNYAITHIMDRLPDLGNEPGIISTSEKPSKATKNGSSNNKLIGKDEIKKILFLGANPINTERLSLGDELNQIKTAINSSTYRDKIKLISESAVSVSTILRALNVHRPHIVHFSGHGTPKDGKGIFVIGRNQKSQLFSTSKMNELFDLFKKDVECIVLNACSTSSQAQLLSKNGMYVIGTDLQTLDQIAIDFSIGFYQSIGEGRNYPDAFRMALIHVPDQDDTQLSYKVKNSRLFRLWKDGEEL